MAADVSLYDSAKSLARNPLGIIALFIVLVYAVASIVITMAKAEFYANPFHPAVLFLTAFPILVLLVFTYLVIRHHRNLYAPEDYKDQRDFFFGMEFPVALRGNRSGATTSDTGGSVPEEGMASTVEQAYRRLLQGGYVMVHQAEVLQARMAPKSGRFHVRVWIESIEGQRPLTDIQSVTYHLWPDFRQAVLSTTDARSNFDLWMSVYGEFPVLALIKTTSGETLELHRHIDLPGRPPD